jgi:hypothetical protein
VTLDALHLDRARAESFGAAPDAYDRFRSTCAEALLDDLAALRPAQVLDVACGTGKTARGLARRGLSVLGVELTFLGSGAPTPFTSAIITPGGQATFLMSTIAPGFQGYGIAECAFQFGHGFAFVSDLGARNLAMGYLPLVVCTNRAASPIEQLLP